MFIVHEYKRLIIKCPFIDVYDCNLFFEIYFFYIF